MCGVCVGCGVGSGHVWAGQAAGGLPVSTQVKRRKGGSAVQYSVGSGRCRQGVGVAVWGRGWGPVPGSRAEWCQCGGAAGSQQKCGVCQGCGAGGRVRHARRRTAANSTVARRHTGNGQAPGTIRHVLVQSSRREGRQGGVVAVGSRCGAGRQVEGGPISGPQVSREVVEPNRRMRHGMGRRRVAPEPNRSGECACRERCTNARQAEEAPREKSPVGGASRRHANTVLGVVGTSLRRVAPVFSALKGDSGRAALRQRERRRRARARCRRRSMWCW